ncbi:hypothetical protein [Peribacillus sp. SCS-155]|uniref:hypothetical protein n=1 Tax=Peribacillus sedimenti TaxID=3115297 RepID=UPI0039059600
MMKLTLMKKVLETVNDEWQSKLAEDLLQKWQYDSERVHYFRASANFLFVFYQNGERHFLRFNEDTERNRERVSSELEILEYLETKGFPCVTAEASKEGRHIETLQTDIGRFDSVVFKAASGIHPELANLKTGDFEKWGSIPVMNENGV